VDFEWDEKKRLANLRKHGLDFRDCPRLFSGPVITWLDVRFDYGEPRFITTGILDGRIVAAVHTERRHIIRIVSMRKASRHEETHYFENILRREAQTIED
jgi:uncharacterized DUF497 family protein